MEKTQVKHGVNPRLLLYSGAAWLLAAVVMLIVFAAIITLADLKASSFSLFGSIAGFLSAVAAGYCAKRRSSAPVWRVAGLSALAIIILLLTMGFVISGEKMCAEGVLSVVVTTAVGCLTGALLTRKAKKIQKRSPVIQRKRKQ